MSHDELFEAMAQSVIDGEPEVAAELARQAVAEGVDPIEAISRGYTAGITVIGDLFDKGECFLPDLMLGGDAMQAGIAVLEPEIARQDRERSSAGRVVIGTVEDDIHGIGKTLVGVMLTADGFQVFDLGVDVPIQTFIDKAQEVEADVIGLSALLTTTMRRQRQVIEALAEAGLRDRVKVIIGGAPVSQHWADMIGADGYAENAITAPALVRRLVGA